MDESVYSEKTVRLPETYWCYEPLNRLDVPVNSLPAIENGHFTFGSLNSFSKLNRGVLSLWAEVLRQVEASRLLLLANPGSNREKTLESSSSRESTRCGWSLRPHQMRREYLLTYNRIDLGLDPFPYNGHTTSLDSLWMGVPMVTLVGETAVSRVVWSQLSNLGLTELAAHTPDEYVKIAVDWAKDLPRLAALRGGPAGSDG